MLYALFTEHLDPEEREKFDDALDTVRATRRSQLMRLAKRTGARVHM